MRELDFIGIGVSRSGTTWTWDQLKKHPQICTPLHKEAKTFLKKRIKARLERYDECPKKFFVGEYTPIYFINNYVPSKIKYHCPNAKLLLMLRNPIERIYTQYKAIQWQMFRGVKESFEYWFYASQKRKKNFYVDSNNYMNWLPLWHKTFKKKLKISLYDDLLKDPIEYVQGVFEHIGVRSNFIPPNWEERESKPYNRYYERNPIKISKSEKKFLINYYGDGIKQLQNYLERDLSHWFEV